MAGNKYCHPKRYWGEKYDCYKMQPNTWKWKASHISDMAFCISDHYVWDASKCIGIKKRGRRASCQAAYIADAGNFHNQVKHIQHSLELVTVITGLACVSFPKKYHYSGSLQIWNIPWWQMTVSRKTISYNALCRARSRAFLFPVLHVASMNTGMDYMDEGWTTAFEYLIGQADLGKDKATGFFKQFR